MRSVAKIKDRGNVCFHVVAPMTEQQKLRNEALIKSSGMEANVALHGRIPNTKVHELMKRSDVLLFTSLSEGTPHVILEAVKNCLPIVCFDICGHGEVVDDSIGIKIAASNPEQSAEAFASTLDRLKDNPQMRLSLSDNCRIKQQQCAWDAKAVAMTELYTRTIAHQ